MATSDAGNGGPPRRPSKAIRFAQTLLYAVVLSGICGALLFLWKSDILMRELNARYASDLARQGREIELRYKTYVQVADNLTRAASAARPKPRAEAHPAPA